MIIVDPPMYHSRYSQLLNHSSFCGFWWRRYSQNASSTGLKVDGSHEIDCQNPGWWETDVVANARSRSKIDDVVAHVSQMAYIYCIARWIEAPCIVMRHGEEDEVKIRTRWLMNVTIAHLQGVSLFKGKKWISSNAINKNAHNSSAQAKLNTKSSGTIQFFVWREYWSRGLGMTARKDF